MSNFLRQIFKRLTTSKSRPSHFLIPPQLTYLEERITPALTVNTLQDLSATDAFISLREAIDLANNTAGDDTIDFASSLFTNGPATISLTGVLPAIAIATSAGTLTITGPGANTLNISANNGNFSVFSIVSLGNLSISGVTVSGANFTSGNGGAFNNAGVLTISASTISGNSATSGGGIFNQGTSLTISDSTISGNSASGFGGGINNFNGGTISVSNSTISNNSATSGGGGIINTNSTLTVSNSTLFGNTTPGIGGGILNFTGTAVLTVLNSTLSGNSAGNSNFAGSNGGGIRNYATINNLSDTIIANSTSGGDFVGNAPTVSSTNNLITNGSLTGAATVTSAQLKLGPLQNNGGPTFTMALLNGSAAIGAGNSTISNASPINGKDQRGINRTTSDIGSYSFGIQVINTSDVNTVGSGSLRAAINLANTTPGNDQISVNLTGANPYTITLATLLRINDANTPITGGTAGTVTITGLGASNFTISGNNGNFSVFTVDTGGSLFVSGVTVSGANSSGNGGAFNNSGTLTVTNSTISGNTATNNGGGIYNSGNLTVSNSIISGNTAGSFGGGIYNRGTLTVSNSIISGNTSKYGGGGIRNGGIATVSNSTLSGNNSSFGGGIYNRDFGGNLTVINTTLSGNSATNSGGGIFNSGTAAVSNTTLSGNTATSLGGGLYNIGTGTLTNSTLSGNSASFAGGGIRNQLNTLTVINTTISGNSATNSGGGISNYSTLNISNTIIANSAIGLDYAGSSTANVTSSNNLITSGTLSGSTTVSSSALNLGPLQNNGGPTLTMALGAGSPAIKTAAGTGTDQRGINRTTNDIGAYSFGIQVINTAPSGTGSLDAAITQANTTPGNDQISFNLTGSSPYTITLAGALPTILDATATASGTGGTGTTVGTVTITGLGASLLTIDGSLGGFSIFNIASGGNLSISGVTVSGANISSGNGGGFNNSGTLNIANSTISGNTVGDFGGGIFNNGALTVTNSTFSGNRANFGGGVFNNSNSTSNISNSTFSGNSAVTLGGGIFNQITNGIVTLTNSTLSGNSARSNANSVISSGGIYNDGTLNIANTIIANSTVINSSSPINDYAGTGTVNRISPSTAANNIVTLDTNTNTLTNTSSWATVVTSAALKLGPLQNNGGPTFTMALLNGSAAIGAGNSTISNASPINGKDQRGINRTTSDIGSYSFGIQVINTSDVNTVGSGSLRAAINLANTTPGNDQITFNLTGSSSYTITLAGALPNIIDATATASGTGGTGTTVGTLTITGLGASALTISGDNGDSGRNFRIFNIASLGNLAISGVTVIGANFTGNGGAFNNIGTLTITNSTISSNSATQQGGGILNFGTLAVSNSTLSGNIAQHGGGFYNSGIATFTNSTISGNSANTGGGAGNIGTLTISNSTLSNNSALNLGGALFNGLTGNLTVSNSTLSGNSASGNGGGGIYNLSTATVTNSTLSGNSAPAGNGGGIYNFGLSFKATLNIANTIIANSTSGGDYSGTGTIGTNTTNLVEDGTLPGNSEITGDPKLGLLQNNGGPTFTMALLTGSPAISTTPLVTPNLDQRGFTRFNSDIGSYAYIAPTVQNDVVVAVNTSGQVGLFLSSAGTEITDFHTAFAGSTLTITAATIGTLLTAPSAGIAGITINNVSTANTITLDLNTLVNFAGLVIVGNSGLDSVTIGTGGVDLSAVTTGAANQSFTANILGTSTSTSALVLTNAIKTKGTAATYLSAGSINGAGLITTPSITLLANTGIGNTTALNLATALISANSTVGAIDINNTSGIAVSVTSLTTSGSAAITFDQTGAGGIGVDGPVTTGTGAITITSQQGILGSGVITQAAGAGGVTFNAGAGVITLTNASNNFTGSVSLNNSGANNVSITDTNAIDFGASTLGSGTFTVNAVGITQSGAITQAANAGAASFNAGAGVITLINLGNNFIGPVSLTNTGAFNVAITDTNDITIGVTNLGTGTFEVTGSTINLNNNITTTNNNQTYTGNVVVNANSGGLPLTLSAGSGAINITGNIDSAASANHRLTINATGDVILGGTIGGTQALGALLITGNNISLGNVGGASAGTTVNLSVQASDGADNGSITLTGTTYKTTGQQFYNSSAVAGVVNDGTRPITLTGGATVSLSSGNGFESYGDWHLGNSVLSIDTTLLSATGGNIVVNDSRVASQQVFEGPGSLVVNAGTTGNVNINGAIGTSSTPLNALTITNAKNAFFSGVLFLDALTITDVTDSATDTGLVQFIGNLTVNNSLTVSSGDYNVQMIGESNTIAGLTTFGNSGSLTFGDAGTDTFNFTGGIIATDPSEINLIGKVTAAGAGIITLGDSGTPLNVKNGNGFVGGTSTGAITLGNAILEDSVTLTVGTGIANTINMAAVTGTASGTSSNLTLNTTGTVTVTGAVGTDIGNLTITNSGGTTFQSTFAAATATITNTTGTVAFQGNLNLTTSLVTATQGYNVSITGTSNSIAGATTFLNTGTVTINNASGPSGDTTTFTGGLVITAPSSIAIQGTVRTTDTTMTLGDANTGVTLSANTTLNAGSGIINLDGVVSGASLTPITSSPGSTTISGANTNATTNVTTGVVQISNTQSTNYVVSGGTLKGTGTIRTLTATGGIIAPGNSAGKITTTSLDLSSGNTLQIEINNVSPPVAGTHYDQIVVSSSGTVNLGGATLSLSSSFGGDQGTVFTIVDNQGSNAVSGTFNGLAEGAFTQANGRAYQISYVGGTGNDVTLTVYNPATVTSFSPTIGKTGTSVVITGSNFTNVSQVSFNGTAQPTYTVNSPTQITTTVPSGATTGAISITTIAGTVTSTNSFTVDNTAPTLSIGASPGSLKANQTSTITFTFSEVVTGFSSSLITVTNGTITNPVASSSTVYTATFTPTLGIKADGTIAVSNNYFDLAGNQGTAATLTPPIAINTIQTPLVTGSASTTQGGSSVVSLVDPDTGAIIGSAVPFPGFTGQIRVVSGDFNGDGKVDIIAAAGPGGGPAVAILDSETGEVLESFFAFDPAFTGGVFIAVRDFNGDAILDIIAGAGAGGGPEVRIFNGDGLTVIKSFFAYAEDFTGGVSVASVDFNNDGILDLVTGAGPTGAPHVKVYDGDTNAIISQWYAYPVSFTGGVYVAAGDIGNDGNIEVVTGAGQGGTPVVAVWDPYTGALLAQFMAYAEDFTGGVRVGVSDGNFDGVLDLITGAGPGGGPQVNGFSFPTLDLLFSFFSGDPSSTDGVFVS